MKHAASVVLQSILYPVCPPSHQKLFYESMKGDYRTLAFTFCIADGPSSTATAASMSSKRA